MGGDPRETRSPHLNLSSPDPCAALSSCHIWPRGSQCSLPGPSSHLVLLYLASLLQRGREVSVGQEQPPKKLQERACG